MPDETTFTFRLLIGLSTNCRSSGKRVGEANPTHTSRLPRAGFPHLEVRLVEPGGDLTVQRKEPPPGLEDCTVLAQSEGCGASSAPRNSAGRDRHGSQNRSQCKAFTDRNFMLTRAWLAEASGVLSVAREKPTGPF